MNNKKFELKLKNAFNQITPDVLDSVMDKCHTQEKTEVITITSSGKKNYALWYTTVAAVFIAIVSIFLIYSYKPTNIQKTAATVYFETDNVLELQLDENNIILNGEHKGESFVNVIKDLFSSKNYKDNSVLVSVVNTDTVRANKLQGYISDVVNKSEYTILSQSYYLDGEILSISDRYEISYSKANLLRDIINTNGLYSYTELSTYSLNQINMLFKYGGVTSGDVVSMGKNTDEDFLSYNEAKEIAFPGKDNCNGKMVFFNNRLSYMIVCEENVLYVDIFTGEILYAVSVPEIIVTESPEVIVTPFPSVYP